MIMWIILGTLIAVVAIFLIFTGIMDRKKTKKIKIRQRELEALRKDASYLIAIWVSIVIEYNDKLLKAFVPSIGTFKMNDVRQSAKKALNLLITRKPYQLIKNSDHPGDRKIKDQLNELLVASSNNWSRNHAQTLAFFQKLSSEATINDLSQSFTNEAKTTIQGVYNEFTK